MKTQVLWKELPVVMDMYSVVLPLRRRASGLARSDHVRMFSPSRWHQSAITDLKWSLCAVDRFSRDAFSPRHLPSYWGLSMSDTFFMKGERESERDCQDQEDLMAWSKSLKYWYSSDDLVGSLTFIYIFCWRLTNVVKATDILLCTLSSPTAASASRA